MNRVHHSPHDRAAARTRARPHHQLALFTAPAVVRKTRGRVKRGPWPDAKGHAQFYFVMADGSTSEMFSRERHERRDDAVIARVSLALDAAELVQARNRATAAARRGAFNLPAYSLCRDDRPARRRPSAHERPVHH